MGSARTLMLNETPEVILFRDVRRQPDAIGDGKREKIRNVLDGAAPWPLVLIGDAGTGKTCAALCILDRCFGMYRTASSWCEQIRKAEIEGVTLPGGDRTLNHFELWERWRNTRIGVLDELGSRNKVSDHHYETVKRAIDDREGKPAIFISNMSLSELQHCYDDRVASRLSAGTAIVFSGKDRRSQ